MADLDDGASTTVRGSGSSVYTLKNTGGVYSCSCPAWRNQSVPIERRTCKHLRALRGDEAEAERLGGAAALSGRPARPPRPDAAPGEDAGDDEGPPLLLAHRWETDVDVTGWWLSEKLDGVRAYWDGKQFLSRLGNRFFPPGWFVEALPDHPLDGELWGGRKRFQRTVGIVKRQDQSQLWEELAYVVFDAPAHGGPFEERLAHARSLVEGRSRFARVLEQAVCQGIPHLREELARVEALGGEGLMARRPGSRYEVGRSSSLLKIKSFKDAEARVVRHVPGAGKHTGRLGALELELADGTRFNVGTGFSDAERERPPAIGALVTFRYQELSDGGVPRFPTFVAERFDARGPSRLERPAPPSPPAAPPRVHRFERREGDARVRLELEVEGATVRERVVRETVHADEGAARAAEAAWLRAASGSEAEPEGVVAPPEAPVRLERAEGAVRRFWEASLEGCAVVTRFGRVGAASQRARVERASPEEAARERDRLVAEKRAAGYEEVSP